MIENMTNEEIEARRKELKDLNKEIRKRKVKAFVKEAPEKAKEFVKAHGKEAAGVVATGLIAGKKAARMYWVWKDQKRRNLEVYDFSLHRRCYLKRKMRPEEEREYKFRLRNGDKVYDILNDMNLLKY